MTEERLKDVLINHEKWLDNKPNGKKANLAGLSLKKANLKEAILRNADLRDANLEYADLRNADLRCTNLKGANLIGSNLTGANLTNANLKHTNVDSLPLWYGSLNMHIDDRLVIQFLYYLLRNVQYSKNVSRRLKKVLLTPELIELANYFQQVRTMGEINNL